MEKTFETPGGVRLVRAERGRPRGHHGRQTDETVVWLEADTPGAEELVERAVVECRPPGAATWWW